MTEGGEVRFGDARTRYQVVRSLRRHKTIEICLSFPLVGAERSDGREHGPVFGPQARETRPA